MQSPLTFEQVLHLIPLAIGYAIILVLFLKSRRDLKRSRQRATAAHAVPKPETEGQGIGAAPGRMDAAFLAAAAAARSQRMAERAELLRTYRRAESLPRVAPALAASQRR